MGTRKTFRRGRVVAVWALVACAVFIAAKPVKRMRSAAWKTALKRKLSEETGARAGSVGVYVKDLTSGDSFQFGAEGPWYLASGVKVPIAITVLQAVERGDFSLDTEIEVRDSEKLDGSGEVRRIPEGTRLTVRHLVEQMIVWSDNTATDMLLRLVGLDSVNRNLAEWVPGGFGKITSLFDVRRLVYCGVHPGCASLTAQDFRALKEMAGDADRLRFLEAKLGLEKGSLPRGSIAKAYANFYGSGMNSAPLAAYGTLLEKFAKGELLTHASTMLLLDIMTRVRTGDHRLRAGLPADAVLAHKTGTQRERVCDFGIVVAGEKRLITLACTQGFKKTETAEAAIREVGEAIALSGALGEPRTAPLSLAKK